jgi:hypothetical protein
MEIKNSKINGEKGLFSTKNFKKDQVVYVLSGEIFDNPTRESIHIGNNKHIHDKFGMYINHSFTPNIRVNGNELVALCDIFVNDELVFNYNDTEINMANPFYVNNILVSGNKN